MSLARLKDFVQETTAIIARPLDERGMAEAIAPVLKKLVATDDWLPEAFTHPDPRYYQQYLLHCDPLERFSVVSFVWGPGQQTPIHDHMVWGLIGMLRGAEISTRYRAEGGTMKKGEQATLQPGGIETLLPSEGDIHHVRNAFDDRVSISIHIYGANIGKVRRHVFDPQTGASKEFISGFSATSLPNIWA